MLNSSTTGSNPIFSSSEIIRSPVAVSAELPGDLAGNLLAIALAITTPSFPMVVSGAT